MKTDASIQSSAPQAGADGVQPNTSAFLHRKKKKVSAQRIAHLIHSYIGLKLSLLFAIVLLTGALAVFAEEIDWLLYSEIRVTPQEQKLDEGALFDRIKEQMPDVGFSTLIASGERERTAAQAFMTLPDGGFKKVWADPYTGEVTGVTNFLTVGTFLSFLHTTLFLPVIGRAFVNFFGVLCLVGLITGLISYRQFWREFFKLPRFDRGLRVGLSSSHRFIGLWSLWFVLIIGVSGSWWFYKNPLVQYKVVSQFLPPQGLEPALSKDDLTALGTEIPIPLDTESIVAAVKAHDGDFKVRLLAPPQHNGMAYSVRGTKDDLLTSSWDSTYYVNPFTGDILGKRLAEDMALIRRVDRAMVPLHYGTWGKEGLADLFVKAIWFIFGMAMTGLSVSGLFIYYQRTKSATKKALPVAGMKRGLTRLWLAVRPWGGPMSVFKYANWAFIAVMGVGFSIAFTIQREGASGSGYLYAEQEVGEWTISLNAIMGFLEKDLEPIQAGKQTSVTAFIKEGNPAAIKFMYVKVKKPRTTRTPGAVIHGSLGSQHAHVKVPKKIKEDERLWITIEDWKGNFHQASWPLMPDGVATLDMRKTSSNDDMLTLNQKGNGNKESKESTVTN